MKFLALCPCERVIVDKDGQHSLINIIRGFTIEPATPTMSRTAVAPREWSIYTMWRAGPEDIGRTFEQWYQIYWPDGEKFSEENFDFIADSDIQQVTLDLVGFPAGQVGDVRIVSWLFLAGHRVSDLIEASIRVTHAPRLKPNPVPTSAQ